MSPVETSFRARMRGPVLVVPMLTRRRPVDYCRVSASLCRCD
ncbi:MAG TPA: hypothetical protein VKB69_01925 [Micromonosporaceae bacterium]|nr:hypothetical protein [Micromonosporaceae bacterium]